MENGVFCVTEAFYNLWAKSGVGTFCSFGFRFSEWVLVICRLIATMLQSLTCAMSCCSWLCCCCCCCCCCCAPRAMRPAISPAMGPAPAPPPAEAPAMSVASAAWIGLVEAADAAAVAEDGAGGVEWPLEGRVGGRGSVCGGDGVEVVVTAAAAETAGGDWKRTLILMTTVLENHESCITYFVGNCHYTVGDPYLG